MINILDLAICPRPIGLFCPPQITIAWKDTPPFLYQSNEKMRGPLLSVINSALTVCCRTNISLVFEKELDSREDLIDSVLNSTVDFVIPIVTSPEKDMFLAFPFLAAGKINFFFASLLLLV